MAWLFCSTLALRSLARHRLRTALTLTATTIGVAVIVVVVSIVSAARHAIRQQVQAAGANTIEVTAGNYSRGDQDPGSGDVAEPSNNLAGGAGMQTAPIAQPPRGGDGEGEGWAGMRISPRLPGRGAAATLVPADLEAIRTEIPAIRFAAAGVRDSAVLTAGSQRLFARLQGTDVEYAAIRAFDVRSGRFLRAGDIRARAKVIVLSASASGKLFGNEEAAGREVDLRGHRFAIVGVVDHPASMFGPAAPLDEVYLPFTTLQDLLKIDHLHGITLSVARAGESTGAARAVTGMLRARHALGPEDPDDFTVRTQASEAVLGKGVNPLLARAVAGGVVNLDQVTAAQMALSLERSSRTMTALLAGAASVSLIVGGIGIMNIMLVAVAERTREIGLRMAVGARGRDVMRQFLAEATALSAAGGVLGAATGAAASGSVGRLLQWSTMISPGSVMLAVGASAAVGLFFGFYPARRASRLDPIDALRDE